MSPYDHGREAAEGYSFAHGFLYSILLSLGFWAILILVIVGLS